MGICTSKEDEDEAIPVKNQNVPPPTPTPSPLRMKFSRSYRMSDTIGEGAFSTVRIAEHRETGEKFAVKRLDRTKLSSDDEMLLRREVEILKSLDHPNIVKFIDFYEERNFFYVVLEYLQGGELFDRILKKNFFTEKEARNLVAVILSTLQFCHDRGIVHRDLKPENLIFTSPDDDANLKIADFGLASTLDGNSTISFDWVDVPHYAAPENLLGLPYTTKVDLWSIGVITYILLSGYPPFSDDNKTNLVYKIQKGQFEFHEEYWMCISDQARHFIRSLLKVNPDERLDCRQALNHPWFTMDEKELVLNHKSISTWFAFRNNRSQNHSIASRNIIQRVRSRNSETEEQKDYTEDYI